MKEKMNTKQFKPSQILTIRKLNPDCYVVNPAIKYIYISACLSNLDFLSNFKNLQGLHVIRSDIRDLSPLRLLTKLEYVFIVKSKIQDLTPLASLHNITTLNLWNNNISDVTPLGNLFKLEHLSIGGNNISDISPLEHLYNLKDIVVYGNKKNCSILSRIQANKNTLIMLESILDRNFRSPLYNIREIGILGL
jgi:internalin A